jgi:hypothetical protein
MLVGVVRSRWASWSSKPVAGRVAGRGGFDSHPLSPRFLNETLKVLLVYLRHTSHNHPDHSGSIYYKKPLGSVL